MTFFIHDPIRLIKPFLHSIFIQHFPNKCKLTFDNRIYEHNSTKEEGKKKEKDEKKFVISFTLVHFRSSMPFARDDCFVETEFARFFRLSLSLSIRIYIYPSHTRSFSTSLLVYLARGIHPFLRLSSIISSSFNEQSL